MHSTSDDSPHRILDSPATFNVSITARNIELCLESSQLADLNPLVQDVRRLVSVAGTCLSSLLSEIRHGPTEGAILNCANVVQTRVASIPWVSFYSKTLNGTIFSNDSPTSAEPASLSTTAFADPYSITAALSSRTPTTNPFLEQEAVSFQSVKQSWVAKELRSRESQYCDYESLKIWIGSWNVNGRMTSENLCPWLDVQREDEAPDMYVFGFQELDLRAEAYLISDSVKEAEWTRLIVAAMVRGQDYVKIASKQLIGMLIMIFIEKKHLPHVSVPEIGMETAGTGFGGVMGNKGGVAIRMRLKDSFLCFVNSHLAADTSQLDRRNQDYWEICRRIQFPILGNLTTDFPWIAGAETVEWISESVPGFATSEFSCQSVNPKLFF